MKFRAYKVAINLSIVVPSSTEKSPILVLLSSDKCAPEFKAFPKS